MDSHCIGFHLQRSKTSILTSFQTFCNSLSVTTMNTLLGTAGSRLPRCSCKRSRCLCPNSSTYHERSSSEDVKHQKHAHAKLYRLQMRHCCSMRRWSIPTSCQWQWLFWGLWRRIAELHDIVDYLTRLQYSTNLASTNEMCHRRHYMNEWNFYHLTWWIGWYMQRLGRTTNCNHRDKSPKNNFFIDSPHLNWYYLKEREVNVASWGNFTSTSCCFWAIWKAHENIVLYTRWRGFHYVQWLFWLNGSVWSSYDGIVKRSSWVHSCNCKEEQH